MMRTNGEYNFYCSITTPSYLSSTRWWNQPVSVLDYPEAVTIKSDLTCNDAIKIFSENNLQQMPVIGKDG